LIYEFPYEIHYKKTLLYAIGAGAILGAIYMASVYVDRKKTRRLPSLRPYYPTLGRNFPTVSHCMKRIALAVTVYRLASKKDWGLLLSIETMHQDITRMSRLIVLSQKELLHIIGSLGICLQ